MVPKLNFNTLNDLRYVGSQQKQSYDYATASFLCVEKKILANYFPVATRWG